MNCWICRNEINTGSLWDHGQKIHSAHKRCIKKRVEDKKITDCFCGAVINPSSYDKTLRVGLKAFVVKNQLALATFPILISLFQIMFFLNKTEIRKENITLPCFVFCASLLAVTIIQEIDFEEKLDFNALYEDYMKLIKTRKFQLLVISVIYTFVVTRSGFMSPS